MSDDRVAVARGLADQLFEADLRGRKLIERTGELALEAWQAFAVKKGNNGLFTVLEQCDRCAFAERWLELASIYAERGKPGVFEALRRHVSPAPPGMRWQQVGGSDASPSLIAVPMAVEQPEDPEA